MAPGSSTTRRVLVLVGVCVLLALGGREAVSHLGGLEGRVDSMGAWGPPAFIVAFAILGSAFVPAGLLTLAAGAIFGIASGIVVAYAGALLGACAAFLISRYLARDLVEQRVARQPRIAAMVAGVSEHGRKIVFLLRLSPIIPYSVINYSMGVTRISLRDFMLASLGMLPVTAMYVYYGAVAGTIVAAARGHATRGREYYVFLGIGLLATVIVTTIVTRIARRALDAHTDKR